MGARATAEWLNERGYTLATGAKFNNSNVTGILGRTHYRGYYYNCNGKVSAGAARCACPHMRQERLDGVVLDALEAQIFEPARLKLLLAEMLEASTDADERRARDLTQARLLKTQSETRLRNLYEALADGKASLKEPVFATMLAEANGRIASLTATVETLERQVGKTAKHITPEMVDAFAGLVRERLRGEDPALRKAYVALFVSEVAIDQETIRISGSTRMLEQAVGKTEPAVMGMVPIFDRRWCACRTHIRRVNYCLTTII